MINNVEFAERLRMIMEHYQLSASSFADRIQVQRSSISHLLSGRNKPSLEFVLKVVKEFPEVELYWLLNGKGSFPRSAPVPAEATAPLLSEINTVDAPNAGLESKTATDKGKKLERIVFFYEDGSFREYQA